MKKYIKSSINLDSGSYLLDRDGNLIPVTLHVPSTTYRDRGINHLSVTDAEFLWRAVNKITEDEARSIALFCFLEFLRNEEHRSSGYVVSLLDISKFNNFAELRYAPQLRKYILLLEGSLDDLSLQLDSLPDFDDINDRWFKWLSNNYTKVSILGNYVEFRIGSDDNYNWNKIIIDDFILKYDKGDSFKTLYTILRESSKGYKAYFQTATIDEILENDGAVLSSKNIRRKVINSRIVYEEID